MFFSLCTLLVAICLSSVSAYYSVLGLTTIFSAAVLPITIMGITLEVAKIMGTVWLHKYWDRASLRLKFYLVPAIISLMLLTSLGGFGFLSKAHLDQMVPASNIQDQVSIIDNKINILQTNLNTNKQELQQINASIAQVLDRTKTAGGVLTSIRLAKSQSKNKKELENEIISLQNQISTLQTEKLPLTEKLNKVSADVGPIRYLAQMIYGGKATADVLESSVRIVIMLIVFVFDPLAIVLILAATQSLEWSREHLDPIKLKDAEIHELNIAIKEIMLEKKEMLERTKQVSDFMSSFLQNLYLEHDLEKTKLHSDFENTINEINTNHSVEKERIIQNGVTLIDAYTALMQETKRSQEDELATITSLGLTVYESSLTALKNVNDYYLDIIDEINERHEVELGQKDKQHDKEKQVIISRGVEWINAETDALNYMFDQELILLSLELKRLETEKDEIINRGMYVVNYLMNDLQKEQKPISEIIKNKLKVDSGTTFPVAGADYDFFVRTDFLPYKIFAWHDDTWVEVKDHLNQKPLQEDYLDAIIEKIENNEINPANLDADTISQIAQYLEKN